MNSVRVRVRVTVRLGFTVSVKERDSLCVRV